MAGQQGPHKSVAVPKAPVVQAFTPTINFKVEILLEKRAGHGFFSSNCWEQI